jgi:antitoxin MazE
MEISVINIGNSKGIRLPKMILEKYSISDKIELIMESGYFILKAKFEPRKNWEESFKLMHENGDDQPLMDDVFEDENFEEWSQ